VGGTVGGVAGIAIIVIAAWFFWRARRRKARKAEGTAELGTDQKEYASELPVRETERSELNGDTHHIHELG
jgi:ABC-type nickel/cobalt efflux system permease component RcnA